MQRAQTGFGLRGLVHIVKRDGSGQIAVRVHAVMLDHGFILHHGSRRINRRLLFKHDAVGLGHFVVCNLLAHIDRRRIRRDLGQLGHSEEARRRVLEHYALRHDHQRVVAQNQRIGFALVRRNRNQHIPHQRSIFRRVGNLALDTHRIDHRVQHRQHTGKLFLIRQHRFHGIDRRGFRIRDRGQRHCQYQQNAQDLLHCLSLLQIRFSPDLQYLRQPDVQKSSHGEC